MNVEDRQLVAAIQAGEPAAFDTLYQRYAGRVYAFARRITASPSDAEDLTQEVFVAAYRGLPSFQGRSSVISWLLGIAVRRQRDHARGAAPYTVPIEEGDGQEVPGPSADALGIRDAIDQLDPVYRVPFLLVAVQGLTHREAAEILEQRLGTVKWRVAEAVKRLRTVLQTDHQEDSEETDDDVSLYTARPYRACER
jgi:RNA polymerase sigma-70 factor, ECF subfamily